MRNYFTEEQITELSNNLYTYKVSKTTIKFTDQFYNDLHLRRSMSRWGNCWDNAPQESFFEHMKDEIDLSKWKSFEEVKKTIDDWLIIVIMKDINGN